MKTFVKFLEVEYEVFIHGDLSIEYKLNNGELFTDFLGERPTFEDFEDYEVLF